MDDELLSYFDRIRAVFLASDTDRLVRFLRLPLAVYSPLGLTIVPDRAMLARYSIAYRAALAANGVERSATTVVEVETIAPNRLKAVARFEDLDARGTVIADTLCRHFLERGGAEGWTTEMIEFLDLDVTQAEAERILH